MIKMAAGGLLRVSSSRALSGSVTVSECLFWDVLTMAGSVDVGMVVIVVLGACVMFEFSLVSTLAIVFNFFLFLASSFAGLIAKNLCSLV